MPLLPSQSQWVRGAITGLTALSDNRWMMPSAHLATILSELAGVIRRMVPGAVVEMGCAGGKTSLRLAAFLQMLGEGPGRPLHLYDSFSGFPEPSSEDEQPANWLDREAPHLLYPEGGVLTLFEEWGNGLPAPILHPGLFSEEGEHPEQVALALLDCDMHNSLAVALRIVWPRLAPGGTVMVHDYGNPTWPGAKLACDAFFGSGERQEEIEDWEVRHDTLLAVTKRGA